MKTNIMLIAIATLTIATANATNWVGVTPLQVVNNTNVPLEFRIEPDGKFLTVPAGQTGYGNSGNELSTYVGW